MVDTFAAWAAHLGVGDLTDVDGYALCAVRGGGVELRIARAVHLPERRVVVESEQIIQAPPVPQQAA